MTEKNWTQGRDGRSNSSHAYLALVRAVEELLCDHRLGTPTKSTARLIVSQLAHKHGMAPKAEPQR